MILERLYDDEIDIVKDKVLKKLYRERRMEEEKIRKESSKEIRAK